MSEPLSDERLAEIRARVQNMTEMRAAGEEEGIQDFIGLMEWQLHSFALAYEQDVPALLSDNDRLRAELAAARTAYDEQFATSVARYAEIERLTTALADAASREHYAREAREIRKAETA